MGQLPAFDDLMELADKDPKAFDDFRQHTCQQFIQSTPSTHRGRLLAIQNRVEVALKRAKTPLAGVLKISGMMHDSLHQLSDKLVEFHYLAEHHTRCNPPPAKSAEIIEFNDWRAKRH